MVNLREYAHDFIYDGVMKYSNFLTLERYHQGYDAQHQLIRDYCFVLKQIADGAELTKVAEELFARWNAFRCSPYYNSPMYNRKTLDHNNGVMRVILDDWNQYINSPNRRCQQLLSNGSQCKNTFTPARKNQHKCSAHR
jgi:hypothetical protein